MSTNTLFLIFTLPEAEIPDEAAPFEAWDELMSKAQEPALYLCSRNNWLGGHVNRAFAEFGCDLGFHDRYDMPLSGLSEYWSFSVLHRSDIAHAIASISRLLEAARHNPGFFALDMGYDESKILAALHTASAALIKGLNKPIGEEDGDGPLYFFGYLKLLREYLDMAGKQGLAVINARYF